MGQQYSIEEFGQKVKEKYPEYNSINNAELGQKMIEKYPEYRDRIKSNVSSSGNTPQTNFQASQPQQPQQKDGFFKSLAKTVVSPVAKLATSAQNVAYSTGKLLKGDVQGAKEELNKSRDFKVPIIPGFSSVNLGSFSPAFTGRESTAGAAKKMVGYGTEIASTIVPVGATAKGATTVGKTVSKLNKVKQFANVPLQFGGSSAIGNLGNQLQGDQPVNTGEVLKSGLIGAAIPLVGRTASLTAKGVGNVGADILGKTTGTSGDVIREAFNNPNVIKFARQAGPKGSADLQKQALEEAQVGFKKMVENKGKEYVAALEKIKSNPQEMRGVVDDLRSKMDQQLENFDVKVGTDGRLDFSNSALDHSNTLQKAYNTVNTWTDHTAAGLDRLKKKLGQFSDQVPSTEQRGGISTIISDLKNYTKQHLNEKVPGYQEMTSKYAQASDLQDEIKKALSLNDTASQDTAIRKLLSTTRENNDLRREFVDVLSGASGTDIRGKLAGSALASTLPKGLTGKIATGVLGGGAVGFLNPSTVPLLGIYFAASSPKIAAEFTSLISKATKPMIRANKFSSQIQNGIRILLQRSLSE